MEAANIKFYEKSVQWDPRSYMWTDGWVDMTKLVDAFRYFCEHTQKYNANFFVFLYFCVLMKSYGRLFHPERLSCPERSILIQMAAQGLDATNTAQLV